MATHLIPQLKNQFNYPPEDNLTQKIRSNSSWPGATDLWSLLPSELSIKGKYFLYSTNSWKMWKLLVIFVALSYFASDVLSAPPGTEKDATTTVKPAKKKHRETFIEIAYGEEKIVLGNFVNASQMKEKPVVEWKMEEDSLYVLLMINLHAPSKMNPVDADYLHWLVVNIPKNDIEKGDTLVEYVGAFPGKDVGNQNFMFILYQQPEEGRMNFTEKFISKTWVSVQEVELNIEKIS